MDPTEILKAAPEIQKIATTIVAGVPLAEIVKRIVLPSADVLGQRMANRVERCFEKTAKMIEDAGTTPQPVADKLVFTILRGASLEDNEDLHTMWAALLANAANTSQSEVLPSFTDLLRQLSSGEAMFLNTVYNAHQAYLAATKHETDFVVNSATLFDIYLQSMPVQRTVEIFNPIVDDLQRMGLLGRRLTALATPHYDGLLPDFALKPAQADYGYHLTAYGLRFLTACRPPTAKS